jgi:predicted ester cyclase
MSLSTNKNIIKSFVKEVFNEHDISATEKYFYSESPLAGTEIFKEFLIAQFKAFPDFQAKIEHIIAERDLVLVFLNFTGTHKGEFQRIPPTNKKISIRSADLYKVENKKIADHWDVVDQLNLMQQIGAILPQVKK